MYELFLVNLVFFLVFLVVLFFTTRNTRKNTRFTRVAQPLDRYKKINIFSTIQNPEFLLQLLAKLFRSIILVHKNVYIL